MNRTHITNELDWHISGPSEAYFLEYFHSLDREDQNAILRKFKAEYGAMHDLESHLNQALLDIEENNEEIRRLEDELEELESKLLDKTDSDEI